MAVLLAQISAVEREMYKRRPIMVEYKRKKKEETGNVNCIMINVDTV